MDNRSAGLIYRQIYQQVIQQAWDRLGLQISKRIEEHGSKPVRRQLWAQLRGSTLDYVRFRVEDHARRTYSRHGQRINR